MTRIIKLEATNFKRLKAVQITPTGDLVVISGRNGQGKTSVLDAITAALGGTSTKALPKPIRDGADRAEIIVETDEYTITRRFTPSGSTLTVTGTDGLKVPAGQKKLDALLGRLSLDPLAFTQLDDRKQRETLLALVDLPFDPAQLDAERAAAFETRTEVNRELKQLHAQTFDLPADCPTEEVSVADLLAKIEKAQAEERDYEAAVRQKAEAADRVERLKAELIDAERGLTAATEQLAQWDGYILNEVDLLRDQVANAEQTNRHARDYAAWRAVQQNIRGIEAEAADLTKRIAEIDQRKADGLKAAKFPGGLPLGFDDTGVLLNGIPFKQASGAEQLRASLAMAIALNPALRVIRIADGSLLDSEGLALVAGMATEHDCQVWIEVVSDGDGFGFMIEDGEIADPDFF